MKTILLFFALLAGVFASAQSLDIKITTIDLSQKIIVCDLSWTGRTTTQLSNVWVFVDYIDLSGNILTNDWKPATVTGATITQQTTGNATISMVAGNTRGVWVKSVSSGANFTGQITLQLSGVPAKFNACAYASDYPPNGRINNGTYILQGSPPFTLIAAGGTTQQVNSHTITISAVTVTPITLTDKTGCPGTILCPYTGKDLFIDASHLCRQRLSGKKNWEAWIKDARDQKLYRIVLMPDNRWWLAQNLKYTANGKMGDLFQSCDEDSCGRFYTISEVFNEKYTTNQQTICPVGWVLPNIDQWDYLTNSISSNRTNAWQDLRSLRTLCYPITDRYGWAAKGRCPLTHEDNDGDSWHSMNGNRWVMIQLDNGGGNSLSCNSTTYWNCTACASNSMVAVRCMRL
ncbi:MAG: hypothetical protein LBF81_00860 [Prevotellaceae bacterium]|jgi:uncharacterized protein (TIGR02145 family)|nr:hypothetical protein [Prevotellaceae bacterium]